MSQETTKTAPRAAEDRADTYAAVEGGETYSGSTLLVEAYAAIWLILFAWIYMIWRKQAELGARLDGLEAAIDRAVGASDKGASDKGASDKGASDKGASPEKK
jgi:hypothetical protein